MTRRELVQAEKIIDGLFRDLRLDIEFSRHFEDRVMGRESDVEAKELKDAFRDLKKKYAEDLIAAKDSDAEFTAILQDMSTYLNIPFSINYDEKGRKMYVLKGLTIMRKRDFKPNKEGGKLLRV